MDQLPEKPLLIYDGACGFCKIWVRYWQARTGDAVTYTPFQDFVDEYAGIPREELKRSIWLVLPNGERFSVAEAVCLLLALSGHGWMHAAYRNVPGCSVASEAAYRFIAKHRDFSYWATRLLWGKEVVPESYTLSRSIFLRGLAVVYLIA